MLAFWMGRRGRRRMRRLKRGKRRRRRGWGVCIISFLFFFVGKGRDEEGEGGEWRKMDCKSTLEKNFEKKKLEGGV